MHSIFLIRILKQQIINNKGILILFTSKISICLILLQNIKQFFIFFLTDYKYYISYSTYFHYFYLFYIVSRITIKIVIIKFSFLFIFITLILLYFKIPIKFISINLIKTQKEKKFFELFCFKCK